MEQGSHYKSASEEMGVQVRACRSSGVWVWGWVWVWVWV